MEILKKSTSKAYFSKLYFIPRLVVKNLDLFHFQISIFTADKYQT